MKNLIFFCLFWCSLPVDGGCGSLDFLVEDSDLELVVLEHLEQIFLLHLEPLKVLLLFHNLLHDIVQALEVVVRHL